SLQRECRESERGYSRAVRSSRNAVSQSSLFIDLDLKDSYSSIDEALEAVSAFLKAIGLQATMIVSSGGGIHIYIGFDHPVSPEEWKPLALGLAEAAKQHGLKFDTQVTVDIARVLRVPGTKNYKPEYGDPQPVQMIGPVRAGYTTTYVAQALAPYKIE